MAKTQATMLPVAKPDLTGLERRYVREAVDSGWISSLGPFINSFEKGWADCCGARYGVSVSNGTVALQLALRALNVGDGDEVIVPALTFVAVAAAVLHVGATPVFVESVKRTGVMDPKAVSRAIGSKTKAIIAVHLYGNPVDMPSLMRIANNKGLHVIEDVAEAHGAKIGNKKLGSFGHVATFSFYGNKIITTGEGGMVVTSDSDLDARMRLLRDHAMDRKKRYWHTDVGYNFRLTNIQAALGCAQLKRLDRLIAKRRRIVQIYKNAFKSYPEVEINPSDIVGAVPWLVCALLPQGTTRTQRDLCINALRDNGVDSRPYFFVVTDMPPYTKFKEVSANKGGTCHIARELSERGINLPTVEEVTSGDAKRIAKVLKSCLNS